MAVWQIKKLRIDFTACIQILYLLLFKRACQPDQLDIGSIYPFHDLELSCQWQWDNFLYKWWCDIVMPRLRQTELTLCLCMRKTCLIHLVTLTQGIWIFPHHIFAFSSTWHDSRVGWLLAQKVDCSCAEPWAVNAEPTNRHRFCGWILESLLLHSLSLLLNVECGLLCSALTECTVLFVSAASNKKAFIQN